MIDNFLTILPNLAVAQDVVAATTQDVEDAVSAINGDLGMLWMLLSGILVFFMQAGFTLVETGMTRSKNAANIAMKNLLDICVGSLTYWLVGYSLMYGDTTNGWFFWSGLMQGEGADLFFQTMFAATAATIVSGAIAGRTKYSTYAIFSVVMTALIYPIAGGWQWQGSGWLTELGFIDFAGSSIVHSVGGWAALEEYRKGGTRIKGDERILGSSDFVEGVLREAEENFEERMLIRSRCPYLNDLIKMIAEHFNIVPEDIMTTSKERKISVARAVLCYLGTRKLMISCADIARELNISPSTVSRASGRGRNLPELKEIQRKLFETYSERKISVNER